MKEYLEELKTSPIDGPGAATVNEFIYEHCTKHLLKSLISSIVNHDKDTALDYFFLYLCDIDILNFGLSDGTFDDRLTKKTKDLLEEIKKGNIFFNVKHPNNDRNFICLEVVKIVNEKEEYLYTKLLKSQDYSDINDVIGL